jgi:hypothetical protein
MRTEHNAHLSAEAAESFVLGAGGAGLNAGCRARWRDDRAGTGVLPTAPRPETDCRGQWSMVHENLTVFILGAHQPLPYVSSSSFVHIRASIR